MKKSLLTLGLVAGLLLPAVADQGTGHDAATLQSIAKNKVSRTSFVRYTLLGSFMGQDIEQEVTTVGTIVDSSGIVLVSGQSMNPTIRQGGRVLPVEFKVEGVSVSIGGKTYEGKIASKEMAKDRVLIRVGPEEGEDGIAEGRSFQAVMPSGKKPGLGDPLVIVSTLGEKYDFAPVIHPVNVCGIAKVPSLFYNVGVNTGGYGAAPVYNMAGELVGVTGMRTELTATGQVRTIGQPGMNPLDGLAESIKKVPAWDEIGSDDDDEGDEEDDDDDGEEDDELEGESDG